MSASRSTGSGAFSLKEASDLAVATATISTPLHPISTPGESAFKWSVTKKLELAVTGTLGSASGTLPAPKFTARPSLALINSASWSRGTDFNEVEDEASEEETCTTADVGSEKGITDI